MVSLIERMSLLTYSIEAECPKNNNKIGIRRACGNLGEECQYVERP